MLDTALNQLAQGLLMQLLASLITAAATALTTWASRKRRKPKE
ncbi:hypothetical protein [Streptomyces sp. NPDC099088]